MRLLPVILCLPLLQAAWASCPKPYRGEYFDGCGDTGYLHLLDISRRMFDPDPEFQNVSMLYTPNWDGFVEGPTWNAWWIQNSYGTSYAALPFLQEPYVTFLQNSQNLWFDQMGDGKRAGCPSDPRHSWVAPDGALCDAARPGCIIYRQGDGRVSIHDWGFEFTAAGVVLQSEFLLIDRDPRQISKYLPKLERSANFIDSRRDPKNNLFLVGPAANLLAPSYAGYRRPDGTYGRAYLAGLSITYIAALDRLIELEKMMGRTDKVRLYSERRELARKGLPLLMTKDGYFIKSLDPDGTRHGVLGAPRHAYFEASPNHDAIAFRVVDDTQARRIYKEIRSLPGLRPHALIIANDPSLDDMYEPPKGLWEFGRWVNGGHWSTCEGRMILAYYRLGEYQDAQRSMEQILSFARRFRMDNPLTNFGADVYQPKKPINITYDAYAPPAAMIRGLFEYLYTADGLTLLPHIPPGITELHQRFPIRFGKKKLHLSTVGSGPVRRVLVNGRSWKKFDAGKIYLPYADTPETARIVIFLGDAQRPSLKTRPMRASEDIRVPVSPELRDQARRLEAVRDAMRRAGFTGTYEYAHVMLALRAIGVVRERQALLAAGHLPALPEPSEKAADQSYVDTALQLSRGIETVFDSYRNSNDQKQKTLYNIFRSTTKSKTDQ